MIELNTLYCGDCLDLLPKVESKSIDYVLTSPPYNRKKNDKYEHFNDNNHDYFKFLCSVTDELLRVTKAHIFMNLMPSYYNKSEIYKYIGKYSDKIEQILIWGKTNPLPASNGDAVTNTYELFIVIGEERIKTRHSYTKNLFMTGVNLDTDKDHKAIMNIEVSDKIFYDYIPKNSIILDPFMGSGTTAISAIKNECSYIGFEICEEYYKKSLERISNFKFNHSVFEKIL